MISVSVVIPARNNARTLEDCLKALKASSFKDYELIVVDAASSDETGNIAEKYADKVITLQDPAERSHVRSYGAKSARGKIIVNIDSDVVVPVHVLGRIYSFFQEHPEVDAVTGLLSRENPHPDFFSQYKNLYMHFIFKSLPDRVTFLYGSIHAIRSEARQSYASRVKIADDTALGQELIASGKHIELLKDLEVIHLKKYNFLSWMKNDFQIPFDWAKLFLQYQGWKQLGKNKTGFAHASKKQLASVIIAPLILLFWIAGWLEAALFLMVFWTIFNRPFIQFLFQEKGGLFALSAFFVTLLDHLIMASGIISGALSGLLEKNHD